MRQPFTALCRSGTSASTVRANTSDIPVLVSVPRPLARLFFNEPHILLLIGNILFAFRLGYLYCSKRHITIMCLVSLLTTAGFLKQSAAEN